MALTGFQENTTKLKDSYASNKQTNNVMKYFFAKKKHENKHKNENDTDMLR